MANKFAHVREIDFDEISHTLPAVRPWGESLDQEIDIFIAAQGFEDRAIAIPKVIAQSVQKGETVAATIGLVAAYCTNTVDNLRNSAEISKALGVFCKDILQMDADHPTEVASVLRGAIQRLGEEGKTIKIVFDISAASGKLILSVMHVLLNTEESIALKILYSEPALYFPQKEEYDNDAEGLIFRTCDMGDATSSHEFGVDEVEVNELYPGAEGESRPELVIAIPAFRTNRLVRCLQHLSDQPLSSPDKHVYWILGEPPASELRWRLDFQKRVVQRAISSIVGFEPTDPQAPKLMGENSAICSTRNYVEILRVILGIADSKIGNNISLVHMGSKLQAIGIALALNVRNEISVCSARPLQFNAAKYTSGTGSTWEIDFGNLAQTIGALKKVGELTFTARIETARTGTPAM